MLITKDDPLIPRILTYVAYISCLSSHASRKHFAVKFIVTMVCTGDNQGLQLNIVIPQMIGKTRLEKFSWQPPLNLLNKLLRYM